MTKRGLMAGFLQLVLQYSYYCPWEIMDIA
jgi:hypothetical protein